MEAQARALNRGFLSRVERGRPWVRIKLGSSLDGRTALASGESKWITGRRHVLMCSVGARASAILTGAGTVLADDPALTVRLGGEEGAFLPPLRVVLDSRLRSLSCVKVRDGTAPTLYLHGFGVTSPVLQHVDFSEVQQRDAGLDLGAVLRLLGERGINEVQVEAGATLCGALLHAGLVDELLIYIAPLLLGDTARPLLAGLDIGRMDQCIGLKVLEVAQVGNDLRLLLRPCG